MSESANNESNLADEIESDEFEVIKSINDEEDDHAIYYEKSSNVSECNSEPLDVNDCLEKSMYSSILCKPQSVIDPAYLLSQSLIKKEFEKIINIFREDQDSNLRLITSLSEAVSRNTVNSLNLDYLIKENMELKKLNETEMFKVTLLETKLSNLRSSTLEKNKQDLNIIAENDSLRSEIKELKNTIEELNKEKDSLSGAILEKTEIINNLEKQIEEKNIDLANSNEIINILQIETIELTEQLENNRINYRKNLDSLGEQIAYNFQNE